MSNSGRIGGSRKSATHRMLTQKEKITDLEGGGVNRSQRRAYSAMARKNMDILKEASTLAARIYNGDVEATKGWLYTVVDGSSPIEQILTGDGHLVIEQLKQKILENAEKI